MKGNKKKGFAWGGARALGILALAFGLVLAGCDDPNSGGKKTDDTAPGVATPVATPGAGAVDSGTAITLATATEGATIRYTTNGTAPTATTGTEYSASSKPTITAAVTLKAIAVKDGMTASDVLTAQYTVTAPNKVATPTADPAAGAVASGTVITLTCTTSGATIRYTTNGTAPTATTGTEYSASSKPTITAVTTLKAIAIKSGMTDSDVLTAAYTISNPTKVATPVATPAAGTYTSAQGVTLTSTTSGAEIWYTIDDSVPAKNGVNSTRYTVAISVAATTTLKAIAVKDGMTDSDVLTAAYTISNPSGPAVDGQSYKRGDTGPGGGKIFYVSMEGFTVYTSVSDTTGTLCHYLEAAPADINETIAWASSGYTSTSIPGTATAIGTGRKNTAIILATDADAPAAKACKDLTAGGKTDWFLPSKDELNQLYENRASVSDLNTSNTGIYWSSFQNNNNRSWYQNFSIGSQSNYNKDYAATVRAVRAF